MNDFAVVVSSCDKYQDLWTPFFTLFFRYWPDCPYPIYLISNDLEYPDSRVNAIKIGEDRDWSSSMLAAMALIPHSYVVLLLEDYLLQQPVETSRIVELAQYMKDKEAGCMRLFPCPGPDVLCEDNPEVGEINKGSDYRLSLQAAIWDKQVLVGLVRKGESPWHLEINGSRRTDELDDPFLSVTRESSRPLPYFCTAVYRGRWLREAVELCEREGIAVDLKARPREPKYKWLSRDAIPLTKRKLISLCKPIIEQIRRLSAQQSTS